MLEINGVPFLGHHAGYDGRAISDSAASHQLYSYSED